MDTQLLHEILDILESEVKSRPLDVEFEIAYQARIAIDRIKFAIKHTEQYGPHSEPMRNAGIQLLDALERLERADRRFQERSRTISGPRVGHESATLTNGYQQKSSLKKRNSIHSESDSVRE